MRESSGPITYHYGGKVTYVTKKGRAISEDALEKRLKAGAQVSVHYVNEDGRRVLRRVEIEED